MKTSMSARRLLSLFAALAFVVVVLLIVQARITASNVVSSPQAAVDQAPARGPSLQSPNAGSRSSQPYYVPAASNVVSSPQAAVDQAPARDPRYNPSSAAASAVALQIAIDNFDASRAGEQSGTVKTAIDVTKDASQLLQEKIDKSNLVLQP